MHSDLATYMWDLFGHPLGLHREDFQDFRDMIWAWFNVAQVGSQIGGLAILIPLVIIWETWLERNRRYHNERPTNMSSIRFKVLNWIRDINPKMKVVKSSPASLRNALSSWGVPLVQARTRPIKILRWSRPPPGYFILNSDGACADHIAVGGGVVRDNRGTVVASFHSFYGSGTNNLAESRALLDGLSLCRDIGIDRIAVRVDSKLVASWFHCIGDIPWSLARWWSKIREVTQVLDVVVAHVYRELNTPADFMATMGIQTSSDQIFQTDFPSRLLGLARLDRLGIPYVRYR
ncbi:Ribonuclease H domain [Macleaya cordata]|uniref:Ribonuclease H domain n=1 Tax=Macleaya cordata TaxID=56857 RepID=A0A200QMY9_MACCD|nr:Ribonuclease H domain [Macleaya cordata]